MMKQKEQIAKIRELKAKKNAVILAHNYQLPEIQDIADFVGDSLGLSQKAADTDADIIVFCGVHFMAETASIIAPNKKVLLPDLEAGCSLAESITLPQLQEWKKKYPDAIVVSYVNTTAEIKTETDYCCTSSNAVKIVESISKDKKILFLPDKHLGQYVQKITGRKIEIWDGACHVHEKIEDKQIASMQEKLLDAEFLIHPECGCSTSCLLKTAQMPPEKKNKIKICSTEGMMNYVKKSTSKEFVIATEVGILHRLKKENRTKQFYPAYKKAECEYMKMINLDKLYNTLLNENNEVKIPTELADKARKSIERMLQIN